VDSVVVVVDVVVVDGSVVDSVVVDVVVVVASHVQLYPEQFESEHFVIVKPAGASFGLVGAVSPDIQNENVAPAVKYNVVGSPHPGKPTQE
jgi:hypothetical protein